MPLCIVYRRIYYIFFAIGLPDLTTTSSVSTEQTFTTARTGKGTDFHGTYCSLFTTSSIQFF